MPKAIQVREDNIDYIYDYGAKLGFDLRHLRDNMEVNAIDGFDTYIMTDGSAELNNVTFTEFIDEDFFHSWKFTESQNPNHFVQITRV